MAVMVPDACPSKASAGEKRLFRLFQDILPDNFRIWYEPVVQGRYPDFVLLADTFGLLVIEVKGWYLKEIKKVTDTEVELLLTEEGQTYSKTVPNPIRQARDYLLPLMTLLAEQPLLRQASGEHLGKLCFPCGYGVLLTNVTRPQLDEGGLSAAFPAHQVICRDELTNLESARNDRETIRRLKQLFATDFPFDPLTADQLKTVQGVVHKEVVVKTTPATSESVPAGQPPEGATVLQVLDYQQEQLAKSVGGGHRVFFGVAGSGKTVLLLARARLLAAQDATKRILILCYNRVLGTALRASLAEDPACRNVQVLNFHAWARDRTGVAKYAGEETDAYNRRLEESLVHALKTWPEQAKYDAILVDEAQDFSPEWLQCIVGALKGAAEGELFLAVDGAQSVYGRPRSFTWKSVGVNAVGRSQQLSKNYRNTRQILDFAWEVTQAAQPAGADTETHVRVQPTEALRTGPIPAYRACATVAEEQAVIAGLIRRFKSEGIPDRDVAVLYPRKEGTRIESLVQALQRTEEVCWITDSSNPILRNRYLATPGVRVCTIHSAKGLEFPAVILCGVDQLPNALQGDEASDANLLYVGLTRAQDHLVLTWTGSSAFTRRVEKSSRARPWNNP
jgi:hypothetical protein